MVSQLFEDFKIIFKTTLKEVKKKQTDEIYKDKWSSVFIKGVFKKPQRTKKLDTAKATAIIKRRNDFNELKNTFFDVPLIKNLENSYPNLLDEFILTYLETTQELQFDEDRFKEICDALEERITEKYNEKYYFFTPIYGLDSISENIELDDVFRIENITSKQFDIISNLDISSDEQAPLIDYDVKQLRCVLVFSSERKNGVTVDPKGKSLDVLTALRLASKGLIAFGAFYGFEPQNWTFYGGNTLLKKGKAPDLIPNEKYNLAKSVIEQVQKILINLKTLNEKCKEDNIRYIKHAIRRFRYIYRAEFVEDKITDLIISLETVMSNSPIEIGLNASLRTAMLMTKNDSETEYYKKFIKKCWSIRSEIVHGKKREEKIKKNNRVLDDSEIQKELERIVRTILKKIMSLHLRYGSQEIILNTIDEVVINRTKRELLSN